VAQHGGGVARARIRERPADRGGRDGLFGLLHQRGDCHAKAKLRTIGLQIGGGAGASFAEAEVGAYDHVVQAKAAVQGFIRKFKRSEGSECRVERQLIQFFHAEFGKTRGARGTAHQPEGRAAGAK